MDEQAEVRASNSCSGFDDAEFAELQAIAALYRDAFTPLMRMANWAGKATDSLADRLPQAAHEVLAQASAAALQTAYEAARASQSGRGAQAARVLRPLRGETAHRVSAAISGALGGAFGLAGTLADLPVTTTLILRSIQQIAAEHGEDLADPAVRAQCLAVFGLGGPLSEDNDLEAGLWAVRTGLASTLSRAGLERFAASETFKLIAQRFGVVVSQKALAQAAPVLGAVAGAAINPAFTAYYQAMAHVHFRLRRLERAHAPEQVRACFERVLRVARKRA